MGGTWALGQQKVCGASGRSLWRLATGCSHDPRPQRRTCGKSDASRLRQSWVCDKQVGGKRTMAPSFQEGRGPFTPASEGSKLTGAAPPPSAAQKGKPITRCSGAASNGSRPEVRKVRSEIQLSNACLFMSTQRRSVRTPSTLCSGAAGSGSSAERCYLGTDDFTTMIAKCLCFRRCAKKESPAPAAAAPPALEM